MKNPLELTLEEFAERYIRPIPPNDLCDFLGVPHLPEDEVIPESQEKS